MTKRIKNTTGSAILHTASGISFPGSNAYTELSEGQVTTVLDNQTYTLLGNGSFVFNDGTEDYAVPLDGWNALKGEYLPLKFGVGGVGLPVPASIQQTGGRDGSGNLRAHKVHTTGDQYGIITSPAASAAGIFAQLSPYKVLRVAPEPTHLFVEKFDGSVVDTTHRWTSATGSGGTITQGSGTLTIAVGTTASAFGALTSKPTFQQSGSVHMGFGCSFRLGNPLQTNTHRFWGFGTAGANTTASPLTDAIGFEIDTSANFNAVVYAGGVKIFSQTLSSIADGNNHRISLVWRTDTAYFFVDNSEVPVATASYQIPNSQILPLRFHIINGPTPPAQAPTYSLSAIGVSDHGRNNIAISDGQHPWRRATVNPNNIFPIDSAGHAQTYRGQLFRVSTNAQQSTSTTELPVVYCNNPANSGKTVKVQLMSFGMPTGKGTNNLYRLYINPTVTANGTTLNPINSRQSGGQALVSQWFLNPTTSANGSLLHALRMQDLGAETLVDFQQSLWIEPGNRLLVAVLLSTGALTYFVNVSFVEEA